MKIQDFVVLDLETTGLSVKEDQILEIGAVKVQGGEVTASYETFVNPGRKVPERITELTGIRDEMIANAPDVETAVRGFLDFCGGLPLLGHNILFDYSFIKQAAINARLDFEKEAWDTLKIARKALPDLESRSLEALCGYYQIPREHAHRAMDDVLETLALFRKLEEGFSEDHPEWFAAAPLKAKMKREVPATEAQKKYLADLIRYHELDLEPEWGALTKSRASRMIDQIILAHGRMEKRQRTEKKYKRKRKEVTLSNKVNRKAPTEAQKKKKDPLAKKRNAAKMLALILAVVMVLGMVLPALLWLV